MTIRRSARPSTGPAGSERTQLSRRGFLRAAGAIGAIGAGGGALLAASGSGGGSGQAGSPDASAAGARRAAEGLAQPTAGGADPIGRRLPGAIEDRVLIVVDLRGGNDGLSTLAPIDDPILNDLRPRLAIDPEQILGLDDEVGLHPAMTRLQGRGLITVEGVGPTDGDLSHFAMTERWQRGDVTGSAGLRNGFLGRLTDAVDDGSPLTGVSVAGPTPHLLTDRASTMALDGPGGLWFLEPDHWFEIDAYRNGVGRLAGADWPVDDGGRRAKLLDSVSSSYGQLLELAADLGPLDEDEIDWDQPMLSDGGALGHGLYLAADLLAADVGVRVVYAADGDYDTHQGHEWRQQDNLGRLDAAVGGFLDRADELGFADRVLVATVSEFGRRVAENDDGLDHGAASTMLVAGPVDDRRLGDRPPLDDLDDDGNLRVTVGFDRYLGALSEQWLGVEAASVLPGRPQPIDLF